MISVTITTTFLFTLCDFVWFVYVSWHINLCVLFNAKHTHTHTHTHTHIYIYIYIYIYIVYDATLFVN